MTTKAAILSSLATVLVVMVLGLATLFFIGKPSSRKAEMLGQGFAMLTILPLGGIWLAWAAKFRKDRDRRQGKL